jgi:hypothetical protein
MKKILSLFVTIALLTASMVYFTGCQNLMGTDAPSVETPKAQKHRITLARNGMTLEGGYAGETTYLILPNVMDTKVFHAYTTVLWADITFKDAATDEILDIPVDIKNECVYFTMPDKDIIFSAESVVESVSPGHESDANCRKTKISIPTEKFKLGYLYYFENEIDEKLKSLVKKAKTSKGKDYWVYEITGWIDPSDCKDDGYFCYFYVDGLVTYLRFGYENTHLRILTQDENGNYSYSNVSYNYSYAPSN